MDTAEYIKRKKQCRKKPQQQHPKEDLQELHQVIGNVLHQESVVNRGAMDLSAHLLERTQAPCAIVSHLP